MSWRILQSCLASPGGVTAWLILITRPSVEQTVPSSSSCCDPGRTTSANRAVSLRKKSVQAKNSSFSSIRLTKRAVRQGDDRVERPGEQAPDLAGLDLAEQLVAVDPGVRQLFLGDAPDAGDVAAMLGVLDVPAAGELVGLLAVLAPALAVALAGDGRVAAARPADPPAGEHDVDRREAVIHAVGVLLHPPGVHQVAGLRRPPPLGRLADRLLGDPGHLGRLPRGPLAHRLGRLLEPDGVVVDEVVVEPVVLDHQVEDAGEQRGVAAGLDREDQVARSGRAA